MLRRDQNFNFLAYMQRSVCGETLILNTPLWCECFSSTWRGKPISVYGNVNETKQNAVIGKEMV